MTSPRPGTPRGLDGGTALILPFILWGVGSLAAMVVVRLGPLAPLGKWVAPVVLGAGAAALARDWVVRRRDQAATTPDAPMEANTLVAALLALILAGVSAWQANLF